MTATVLVGDCRDVLRTLPERSVQTCITSPPYFGLRDYGTGEWDGGDPACDHLGAPHRTQTGFNERYFGREKTEGWENKQGELREPFRDVCGKCGARRVDRQIGLEPTPDEFVQALVAVFREVRRVLRDDGTVWLNLGDSYNAYNGNRGPAAGLNAVADQQRNAPERGLTDASLKPKDLIGVPWMVAFALRADGWYLRSDIIWAKPNPMPESVTDRPTKAHEYLFLLSKGPKYYWDADAIREPKGGPGVGIIPTTHYHPENGGNGSLSDLAARYKSGEQSAGRNKRSVWTVSTQPYAGAHFATFPPKLIEPCVLAGSAPKACGECGAPWRRIVERERLAPAPPSGMREVARWADGQESDVGGRVTSRTIGWEPSCEHRDVCPIHGPFPAGLETCDRCEASPIPVPTEPSVVLDPFNGAGTTGVVAGQLGRDYIGIELNPEYAAMARERIALEGRPGGKPATHAETNVMDGQLSFG